MDPTTALVAISTISSIFADALIKRAYIQSLKMARTHLAVVMPIGKEQVCSHMETRNPGLYQCVDVEKSTMDALDEGARASLECLNGAGASTQRDRMLALCAVAHVAALKRRHPRTQFLFITSSFYMAHIICRVQVLRIETLVPSLNFEPQSMLGKSEQEQYEAKALKMDAIRAITDVERNVYVFDSWDMLKYYLIKKYKLVFVL
jgi:hypothetical protein